MLKLIFIGITIACYLIAFISTGLKDISTGKHHVDGYICFLFGPLGFIYNIWMTVAWLANIPFMIALFYLMNSQKTALTIICSALALLLSLATFWVDSILINEGGDSVNVKMGFGAYCWIAAIASLLIGSLLYKFFPNY